MGNFQRLAFASQSTFFPPDELAKTIARIEQGKVERVQKRTLETIARRLKVKPEEIETY